MIEINEMTKSGIDLSRFRQEVETVKAEYAEPRSLKWAPLAVQVGLSNLYELSYRLPSGDGAHVTLAALHRHFDKDEHECSSMRPSSQRHSILTNISGSKYLSYKNMETPVLRRLRTWVYIGVPINAEPKNKKSPHLRGLSGIFYF